jgi:hypothetical protein
LIGVGRASVLPDNKRMLGLLTRYSDIKERKTEDGVVELAFEPRASADPTGPAEEAAR